MISRDSYALDTIVPNLFVRKQLVNGWSNPNLSVEASSQILTEATIALGVSRYRLGQLLDISHDYIIYRWGSARSISALYLGRLFKLMSLQAGGVDFSKVACIDWCSGQIFWRQQDGPGENLLLGGKSRPSFPRSWSTSGSKSDIPWKRVRFG